MVGLLAVGMVSQLFMQVDAWVHKRANSESTLVRDLAALTERFDKANEKFSAELSRWQTRVGENDSNIRVLKEHVEGQDRQILALERQIQRLGSFHKGDPNV